MSRMNNILNNIFDIMVIGGKLIIDRLIEFWNNISYLWYEEVEKKEMWNGGRTFLEHDYFDESEKTTTPYDEGFGENNLINKEGNIIYDGVYDD
tara:strand:- start:417 stop:698 length:282 start_codon:yes stop_codon:yes gene_type:complete